MKIATGIIIIGVVIGMLLVVSGVTAGPSFWLVGAITGILATNAAIK